MERNIRTSRSKPAVFDSRNGYRLAAPGYTNWHWFQFWRRNELPLVRNWATSLKPGLFLDAGSGTGLYPSILERAGHRVIAVDLSFEMLSLQTRKHSTTKLVQASIEALPFSMSSFDYLLCTRVLSHIRTPDSVLFEFSRVAKPGAILMIADVHPEHRYSDMSIPLEGKRISIQTFKHSIGEIRAAVAATSLQLLSLQEYRLQDIAWRPPIENFANVYDEPERPIFYMCVLTRR